VRRVPQDASRGLIGLHVACPRCGFVSIAVHGSDGMAITEGPLAFSVPLRCLFCAVLLHVEQGAFRLEEDEHALPLRH
jgi:hypothetical protein